VHWTQIVFGTLLVVVLLALAGYYAWRQVQTLRGLRDSLESPPEERRYLRRRAWRRLFGCALMVALALMLGGMMLFLEQPVNELADFVEAARERGEDANLSNDQRLLRTLYALWNITLLLTLLAILITAAIDMFATRRFGLGQLRRIQADRRAMIERQVARLRQEGNGHP
jgi:ABC-type Fe3+ transport system permease subunit